MKLLLFPKNYTITLRDSENKLVGSSLITEQTPVTFFFSKRKTPKVFESIEFTFNHKNMSIKVNGKTFDTDGVIDIGADEDFAYFTFVDTEEIEPMTALMNR